MQWFYLVNGEQRGPVSDAQFQALAREGGINESTLVWRKGMADWQPLSHVSRTHTSNRPTSAVHAECFECGTLHPESELIRLNKALICASCKPAYLQKLSEGVARAPGMAWRKGRLLVTESNTKLHDRCVKCNRPADGYRLKRPLRWHNPLVYLLLLFYIVPYVIAATVLSRHAVLYIGLCDQHRQKRKMGLTIGWSGCALGAGLLVVGVGFESELTVLAGILALVGAAVAAGIITYTIRATKITREHVMVTGCHLGFLAELPEWQED